MVVTNKGGHYKMYYDIAEGIRKMNDVSREIQKKLYGTDKGELGTKTNPWTSNIIDSRLSWNMVCNVKEGQYYQEADKGPRQISCEIEDDSKLIETVNRENERLREKRKKATFYHLEDTIVGI